VGGAEGLVATGGVITSAGAVLTGTSAMLGTLPMVMFAETGFAVGLGAPLDTIVVGSVLVTALTLDIGRWMWWPDGLARRRDVIAAGSAAGPGGTVTGDPASGSVPAADRR
jgi:putative drug exporter of the RND superfamily